MDLQTILASEYLRYLSIPLTSAVVGWATNVIALKMTFYPLDFVGIRPVFGWQGIIPAKAESMARRTVDLITTRLVGVQEVIDRLEADKVVESLVPGMGEMLSEIIDDVMSREHPELWAVVPPSVKNEIYAAATREAPMVIKESLHDLQLEIDEVLDLEEMAVEALLKDRAFLNHIFLECGREEFRFIERSGLYFGFVFGLMVMTVWVFWQNIYLLPTVGFVIGYLTNFLALKMIFEPAEPKNIFGFKWQGGFLKRQQEVSEAYARLITAEIVNSDNILRALFEGPYTDRLLDIVQRHVEQAAEVYSVVPRPVANLLIGSDDYDGLKSRIGQKIVAAVPEGPIYNVSTYAEEALDLENTLRDRLQALPPDQFTGLLRPIFQEDEWKLILVGAVLGLLVGIGQAAFLT